MYTLEEKYRILRVTTESKVALPGIVVVTSALREDGVSQVASGLARAFAEAGERTLFIDADAEGESSSVPSSMSDAATRAAEVENLFVLALKSSETQGGEKMAALLSALREDYRVIVVGAAAIPASALALDLARKADGVLFAVKLGRRIHAADQTLRQLAAEVGSRLIGVVPTKPEVKTRFARVTSKSENDLPIRNFRGAPELTS